MLVLAMQVQKMEVLVRHRLMDRSMSNLIRMEIFMLQILGISESEKLIFREK